MLLPFTGQNFSVTGKTLSVTGREFLSEEEISCQRKKFPVTWSNFLSQEDIFCHRKNFHLERQNFKGHDNLENAWGEGGQELSKTWIRNKCMLPYESIWPITCIKPLRCLNYFQNQFLSLNSSYCILNIPSGFWFICPVLGYTHFMCWCCNHSKLWRWDHYEWLLFNNFILP